MPLVPPDFGSVDGWIANVPASPLRLMTRSGGWNNFKCTPLLASCGAANRTGARRWCAALHCASDFSDQSAYGGQYLKRRSSILPRSASVTAFSDKDSRSAQRSSSRVGFGGSNAESASV
jgi:hypothetical protein